jgi:hypothetical protein
MSGTLEPAGVEVSDLEGRDGVADRRTVGHGKSPEDDLRRADVA